MIRFGYFWIVCVCLFGGFSFAAQAEEAQEVNLYYSGKEHLLRPLLERFTEASGIKVNMITGSKSRLVTRLQQEGEHTPADVLITVDIGNVYAAKKKGLLQSIDSEILKQQIPANLRDPDGKWFGFTVRSRAIFYAKDRVSPEHLQTYEGLTNAKWKGKLLVRSSSNVYNQSLLASRIAHFGEKKAKEWAAGIVANFARTPKGGDRDQLRAVAVGEGDVALANTYYFGRMLMSGKASDREAAAKLGVIFPNQAEGGLGAHINIRGGGVTKHAKHKDNAVKLLEFLASDASQLFFAEHNFEHPAKEGLELPELLQSWGDFKRDALNLEEIGKHSRNAMMMFDEVGWP